MARPEKEIDWEKVDNLLIAGCSGTEIAPHFDIHYSNFYDRVVKKYGMSFTDYAQEKRQKGDSLLRATQFQKAIKGDNNMLIWLGKNRLGQKETHETLSVPNDKVLDNLINEIKSLKGKIDATQPQTNSELQ